MQIANRAIGPNSPTYIVAEMSANHNQGFEEAARILEEAKDAGADAVKVQTYTPDTMTIDAPTEWFRISGGTPWDGRTLYELYGEAFTPWEWQPKLKNMADAIGLDFFSTAFDASAVRFLEEIGVPVHKTASFEIVDLPLIRAMASTGKPLIISTGMSTLGEIDEAIQEARAAGARHIALLHCVSSYPAPPSTMHLRTIPNMREAFNVPVGLSDHTLGIGVPIAAVALGACIVEKHLTLSRDAGGPDAAFSLEPQEFRSLVQAIRQAEDAMGEVRYGPSEDERKSIVFRRSIFAVRDIEPGETLTEENVRVIRPGQGLLPRYLDDILGRRAAQAISRGTPISWDALS